MNEKLSANSGAKTRNEKHFYLLRGRVICGKCGQPMYPQRYEKQPDVYRCRHKLRGRGDCPGVGNEKIEDVESYTWSLVCGLFSDPKRLVPEIRKQITEGQDSGRSAERDEVVRQIKQKDRTAQQLMHDLSDPDVLDRVRQRYRTQLDTIEAEIEQLERRRIQIEAELRDDSGQDEMLLQFVAFLEELLTPLSDADWQKEANEQRREGFGPGEMWVDPDILRQVDAEMAVTSRLNTLPNEIKRQIIELMGLTVTVNGHHDYDLHAEWRPVEARLVGLAAEQVSLSVSAITTCRTTQSSTPA